MWDVIILAFALSMDAFAVSIGLGAKQINPSTEQANQNTTATYNKNGVLFAGRVAIYFGVFQGVMPLIGFIGGHGVFEHSEHDVLKWVMEYSNIIAFILLAFIGGKMIYESFSEGIEEDLSQVTPRILLMLAIATSIDAMAAGFSLPLIDFNPFIACLLIGVITLVMSFIGVFIGKSGATWLESKAELLGGVILVLIAFKLLLVG